MASRITNMNKINRMRDIVETLKKKPDIDLNELAFEIAATYGCCIKTAREYLKIAVWKVKNEIS